MLVGLHANLADSAFTKLPFERVGRTDSRGRFSIRGVAPGKYRIYALQDADQNFAYSQPTEVIAFNDSIIIPSMEERHAPGYDLDRLADSRYDCRTSIYPLPSG